MLGFGCKTALLAKIWPTILSPVFLSIKILNRNFLCQITDTMCSSRKHNTICAINHKSFLTKSPFQGENVEQCPNCQTPVSCPSFESSEQKFDQLGEVFQQPFFAQGDESLNCLRFENSSPLGDAGLAQMSRKSLITANSKELNCSRLEPFVLHKVLSSCRSSEKSFSPSTSQAFATAHDFGLSHSHSHDEKSLLPSQISNQLRKQYQLQNHPSNACKCRSDSRKHCMSKSVTSPVQMLMQTGPVLYIPKSDPIGDLFLLQILTLFYFQAFVLTLKLFQGRLSEISNKSRRLRLKHRFAKLSSRLHHKTKADTPKIQENVSSRREFGFLETTPSTSDETALDLSSLFRSEEFLFFQSNLVYSSSSSDLEMELSKQSELSTTQSVDSLGVVQNSLNAEEHVLVSNLSDNVDVNFSKEKISELDVSNACCNDSESLQSACTGKVCIKESYAEDSLNSFSSVVLEAIQKNRDSSLGAIIGKKMITDKLLRQRYFSATKSHLTFENIMRYKHCKSDYVPPILQILRHHFEYCPELRTNCGKSYVHRSPSNNYSCKEVDANDKPKKLESPLSKDKISPTRTRKYEERINNLNKSSYSTNELFNSDYDAIIEHYKLIRRQTFQKVFATQFEEMSSKEQNGISFPDFNSEPLHAPIPERIIAGSYDDCALLRDQIISLKIPGSFDSRARSYLFPLPSSSISVCNDVNPIASFARNFVISPNVKVPLEDTLPLDCLKLLKVSDNDFERNKYLDTVPISNSNFFQKGILFNGKQFFNKPIVADSSEHPVHFIDRGRDTLSPTDCFKKPHSAANHSNIVAKCYKSSLKDVNFSESEFGLSPITMPYNKKVEIREVSTSSFPDFAKKTDHPLKENLTNLDKTGSSEPHNIEYCLTLPGSWVRQSTAEIQIPYEQHITKEDPTHTVKILKNEDDNFRSGKLKQSKSILIKRDVPWKSGITKKVSFDIAQKMSPSTSRFFDNEHIQAKQRLISIFEMDGKTKPLDPYRNNKNLRIQINPGSKIEPRITVKQMYQRSSLKFEGENFLNLRKEEMEQKFSSLSLKYNSSFHILTIGQGGQATKHLFFKTQNGDIHV